MRRMVLLLAGVLLCVVALGSDSPKEYDDRTTLDELEGTWRAVSDKCDGQELPCGDLVVTYRGRTFVTKFGDETVRGSFRIDPTRNPPHLDYTPSNGDFKGQTSKCIYQIKGNTLRKVEGQGSDMRRPQGFNEKGSVIATYKRVK